MITGVVSIMSQATSLPDGPKQRMLIHQPLVSVPLMPESEYGLSWV